MGRRERDVIACPHPFYGRLAALCDRAGYWLELHRIGSSFELRVAARHKGAKTKPLATPFDQRRPDGAAKVLLDELK